MFSPSFKPKLFFTIKNDINSFPINLKPLISRYFSPSVSISHSHPFMSFFLVIHTGSPPSAPCCTPARRPCTPPSEKPAGSSPYPPSRIPQKTEYADCAARNCTPPAVRHPARSPHEYISASRIPVSPPQKSPAYPPSQYKYVPYPYLIHLLSPGLPPGPSLCRKNACFWHSSEHDLDILRRRSLPS